jgi:hypothetical protein
VDFALAEDCHGDRLFNAWAIERVSEPVRHPNGLQFAERPKREAG